MRRIALLFVCAAVSRAQDPFEVQIFEYEPLPFGAYTAEAHINYVLDGTKAFTGPVAPTQDVLHVSSEWTMGITDEVRAGFVLLTALRPGQAPEYAGFRLLPHFYAPRSWNLPVNLGLVTEFSFEHQLFDENTRQLEVRGIVEKHVGRLQMDGNLVFARTLHGPGTSKGWGLEPSTRIAWQAFPKLTPSLEYYGSIGQLGSFAPVGQQIHIFVPGADWKITDRLTWSFGLGLGATDAASRVILKSRIEIELGKKHD